MIMSDKTLIYVASAGFIFASILVYLQSKKLEECRKNCTPKG